MAANVAVVCPLCERAFGDEDALLEHCGGLLPEPEDEPYYCSCGVVFCSPVALATHCESAGHAPEGAGEYGGEYETYGGDGDGAEAVTPRADGSVACPICGADFPSTSALAAHGGGVAPGLGEAPHWCSCGRRFCSASALDAHATALGHEPEEAYYDDDDGVGGDGGDYEALSRLDESVVTRGLSAAARAGLVDEILAAPLEDPITRETVPAGGEAVRLPCGHAFLRPPLLQWFETSRICPVCRLEIEA